MGSWLRRRRIIPAYAGSTWLAIRRARLGEDHPRIRGEHLGLAVKPSDRERIIPAYAGSTIRPPSRSRRPEDHPRIRGEHASCCAEMLFAVGSSPHTRGAHAALDVEGLAARIIPAYAGSTVAEQCTHWVSSDHPRIRGEHRDSNGKGCRTLGSSPHTRGALLHAQTALKTTRIIPAYAGSTPEMPVPRFQH